MMEFRLPHLAEGIEVAKVVRVAVEPGSAVEQGQVLLELETEKVSMEVPSPAAGRVQEVRVREGEEVRVGSVVMLLDEVGAPAAAALKVELTAPTTSTRLAPTLPAEPELSNAPPVQREPAAPSSPPPPVTPSPLPSPQRVEFRLPALAEGVEAADVAAVLVAPGETVEAGQAMFEMETEKASAQIPAPAAGRVEEIRIQRGEKVRVGAVMAVLLTTDAPGVGRRVSGVALEGVIRNPSSVIRDESAPAITDHGSRITDDTPTPPARHPTPDARHPARPAPGRNGEEGAPPVPAGPATRRLARELGVDLRRVPASGRGGRVTPEDVKSFVRDQVTGPVRAAEPGTLAAPPLPDFAQWGEIERRPIPGIRRRIAENLSLAWRLCPQVTQYDQADVTELEAGRRRYLETLPPGAPKVTMTVLAIKAVVAALKAFPQFNSSLDTAADAWVFKKYYHIGVAVDTEHGLLVPVVRDADRKNALDLAQELADLAERARARKLGPEEMRGGTFTITNLGGIGGTAFSPIVNYPEVAILGISRAAWQSVVIDGSAQIRLVLPLCLSYDHRVIDGADGARFTSYLAKALSDPVRLLMEC
jgi:pyruvate dehydrogenase E2 component (dihydrolipoyllysine-residue acetyltransferase)